MICDGVTSCAHLTFWKTDSPSCINHFDHTQRHMHSECLGYFMTNQLLKLTTTWANCTNESPTNFHQKCENSTYKLVQNTTKAYKYPKQYQYMYFKFLYHDNYVQIILNFGTFVSPFPICTKCVIVILMTLGWTWLEHASTQGRNVLKVFV